MAKDSWDDEESGDDAPGSPIIVARRSKFDDEEDDNDVLDSWDAAEDSEVEREKAKKAEEAKAKAEEEAKKNHKSKAQRIEERRAENMRKRLDAEALDDESDEDDAERRARFLAQEKEADLGHAEDLFGDVGGVPASRSKPKAVTVEDKSTPGAAIDLSSLPLFNPTNKDQFTNLRETLVPLLTKNSKHTQYGIFMPEFVKAICKDLPSDQIKKVASALTTLSNEKLKEEKAEKGGKKSKAAKTKTTLSLGRNAEADTTAYDDGLDDDDFF